MLTGINSLKMNTSPLKLKHPQSLPASTRLPSTGDQAATFCTEMKHRNSEI